MNCIRRAAPTVCRAQRFFGLDVARTADALGLEAGEQAAVVLSFGYPATGHTADRRTADEWIARAERKPLDELVTRI